MLVEFSVRILGKIELCKTYFVILECSRTLFPTKINTKESTLKISQLAQCEMPTVVGQKEWVE